MDALTDKSEFNLPISMFCPKPLNPKTGANAICGVFTRFRQSEVKNGLKRILYMNEQSPISRRQAISGLGTGLVAVAVPQIFAASDMSQQESVFAAKLEDPVNKYPKPPFNA